MDDVFRDLERRLLSVDVRRSPAEVSLLLSDDFIEFGSSGAVYDRQQTLDGLASEQPMDRSMTDFSARALSDDIVLVTYRAVRHDPRGGRDTHSLRSSIWRLADGRWRMAFHQGTPAP